MNSQLASVLARRATQCSFSSAFHAQLPPQAQSKVNSIYLYTIAPVLVAAGVLAAVRLDAAHTRKLQSELGR